MRHGALIGRDGAFWLTVAAFTWSVALILVAFTVPTEQITSGRAIGGGAEAITHTHGSTLVARYGVKLVVLIVIPAIVSGLVWVALHRRCKTGSRSASKLAWGMIALLTVYAFVGGFSIGLWAFPVVALLGAAAMRTPVGRH